MRRDRGKFLLVICCLFRKAELVSAAQTVEISIESLASLSIRSECFEFPEISGSLSLHLPHVNQEYQC